MIGDLHGTPEYRAHLIEVLTGRAVEAGPPEVPRCRPQPAGRAAR